MCQSCGMPLDKTGMRGTEADGSASAQYCSYCYGRGGYTEPGISMKQMSERVAGFMTRQMGIPPEQAKKAVSSFLPGLKRWKRKKIS